jgi:hypothetical protein
MDLETYLAARNGLIKKDLLAFDGIRFQILSLPDRPVLFRADVLAADGGLEAHDRAVIRRALRQSLAAASDDD